MIRQVGVLRAGWEELCRALEEPTSARLAEVATARGAAVLRDGPRAGIADRSTSERLRSQLTLRAAAASAYRRRLVVERHRLPDAKERERRTYEEGLALDRDRVPPLKLRAKALRARVRRLEAETRARGLDPDAIEPKVDWPETLSVDTFEPPRYGSGQDRKRAAVEFFRRLG